MKDENDKVWFFYASQLKTRNMAGDNMYEFVMPSPTKHAQSQEGSPGEGEAPQSPKNKDRLMDDLDAH